MWLYLTRQTGHGSIRFYKMVFSMNLFGEFFIFREYGNVAYKSATGHVETCFSDKEEAIRHYEQVKLAKERKGYR